jgi:hypothetical protein
MQWLEKPSQFLGSEREARDNRKCHERLMKKGSALTGPYRTKLGSKASRGSWGNRDAVAGPDTKTRRLLG